MPADVGAEIAQADDCKRGCADAVDVVIAVDADPGALANGAVEQLARFLDIPEPVGVVRRHRTGEKRIRRGRIAVAATHENTRRRLANAELCSERTRLGGVAAGE